MLPEARQAPASRRGRGSRAPPPPPRGEGVPRAGMEGSGDEEPGAEGPLQQLVKRQRKEKRELQGERRRGPVKGEAGERAPSGARRAAGRWREARGGLGWTGLGVPLSAFPGGTLRGGEAGSPGRRQEKRGGAAAAAFATAGFGKGSEQPWPGLCKGERPSVVSVWRLGRGVKAVLCRRAWFSSCRPSAELPLP